MIASPATPTPVLDPTRLLILARECGAAVAGRSPLDADPFAPTLRFARLVRHPALKDAPRLRRELVGAFVDAFVQSQAERRERLAAVEAEDVAAMREQIRWERLDASAEHAAGVWE